VNTSAFHPKVILVDDHPEILRRVAGLLADEFQVVATLPDGRGLQSLLPTYAPDLVVLDISLPGLSGLELARQLLPGGSVLRIVFLTVHADADYARAALAAGALGYVVKPRLASDLIPALRAAIEGRHFISPCPQLEGVP
jgi:DNA-binding NarL/FixJ family response regulator